MADAIQILIAELQNYRKSGNAEPIKATVTNMVNAFEEIEGALPAPGGTVPENEVYAGPVSGAAAAPTFRTLVQADLEQFNVATGNKIWASPNGAGGSPSFRTLVTADIPSLAAIYLPLAGGTMTGTEQFADGSQFSATGLAMAPTKTITPDQLAGIVGTTTNNSANAGAVGEFIESDIGSGAAVGVNSGVSTTVTSIALTAGDWDIDGQITTVPGASTLTDYIVGGINVGTAATLPALERRSYSGSGNASIAGFTYSASLSRIRASLAANTTVYLVVSATFSVSTLAVCGYINARRVR